ncbi:hypothetical protein ANN_08640 [Periplaneta americana]|uniref:Uncharacterized protein n=1 Tax=Periplaneta americana TaxID=6978 RepID=A0ABQ8T1Z8_PERAM|nr:hypothetical protein ANN_08640 [Periplaneta americana]
MIVQRPQTTSSAHGPLGHRTSLLLFPCLGFRQGHCRNYKSASTPLSGASHKTFLTEFGVSRSTAWTSAVPHVGRTSNAFKRRITYVPEKLPSKYGVHSEQYLPIRTVTPEVSGM